MDTVGLQMIFFFFFAVCGKDFGFWNQFAVYFFGSDSCVFLWKTIAISGIDKRFCGSDTQFCGIALCVFFLHPFCDLWT